MPPMRSTFFYVLSISMAFEGAFFLDVFLRKLEFFFVMCSLLEDSGSMVGF